MAKLQSYDGTVTIDSAAANEDMRKVKECANILQDVRDLLKQAGVDSAHFAGDAGTEFGYRLKDADSMLNDAIWEANNISKNIGEIVTAYERSDAQVRARIESELKMIGGGA